jgi:3-oxoadipate enol-lactonase
MGMIPVGARQVYYEQHGDFESAGAAPLMLISGMAGSCSGWLPLQVPEFAQTRPVLIFDHRGVGQSSDPGDPFEIADLAQDALDLLDALALPKVALLGTFMGGMIAQEMALSAPERIERLILVGTYARPDAKRRMLLQHWTDLVRQDVPVELLARHRLLWTLQDDTLEQGDLIEDMIAAYTEQGPPLSAEVFARQCTACSKHDTLDRLAAVACPTLVVSGRNDIVTPPKFHRELADGIHNARLVTLSYGGHLVMVESAERFNQTVLQFLAGPA